MSNGNIVGDSINFRGLVYGPLNEDGVIFLFGKVVEDLNMYVEQIRKEFPDCIGRRFTGKGWEQVTIEFEYKSSNFQQHGHNPDKCNILVCWEHDWPECTLEVIELKEIIKTLPNKAVERPDRTSTGAGKGKKIEMVENHLRKYPENIQNLFKLLDQGIKEISEEIWRKVGTTPVCSYYSPERNFVYVTFQRQGLRIELFTKGQQIEGIKQLNYTGAAAKWGQIHLRTKDDLPKTIDAIKKSYGLIREAIKKNESTGWYAKLEDSNDTKA